jgi:ABC-type uncharacterized transport system, permease component
MKSFAKLVSLSIQSKIYFRQSFILNLFTPVVLLVGSYLLWNSLYTLQGGIIGTMNRADMFTYILISFAINNLLTWSTENVISREITHGTITSKCIRPVPFILQMVSEMTGSMLIQGSMNLAVALLGFLLFSKYLILPTLSSLLLFIPCLILGVLLRIMMTNVFSLLCFFTTSHLGISWTRNAIYDFFSGAVVPVAMFPLWLKSFTYFTPFPYMLQAPISIFLNQPMPVSYGAVLLLQLFYILLLLLLHHVIYGHVRKNLTIAGG